MRRFLQTTWHLLALTGLAALVGAAWFLAQGISARPAPPAVEATVARTARNLLIPAAAARRPNPEAVTPENIASAMAHYADHCAACHAADGSGDTAMGRGMYPRPPDMRQAATQGLSDGELFYLIEEGVKLTGMPGWATGTPEGEADSWHLVHFIRRLPTLTEEEIAEVEALMPLPEAAWKAREEERRFLAGEPALEGELRLGPRDTEHVHAPPKPLPGGNPPDGQR
ncbi:MAG: c-type cytochrome [Acidobacteriota bacterium]